MTAARLNTRVPEANVTMIDIDTDKVIRSDKGRLYVPNQATVSGDNDEHFMVYQLPGALEDDYDYYEAKSLSVDTNSWVDHDRQWDKDVLNKNDAGNETASVTDMPMWLFAIYCDFRKEERERPEPVEEEPKVLTPLTISGNAPGIDVACNDDRGHQWTPIFKDSKGIFWSEEQVHLGLAWRCVLCDYTEDMETE